MNLSPQPRDTSSQTMPFHGKRPHSTAINSDSGDLLPTLCTTRPTRSGGGGQQSAVGADVTMDTAGGVSRETHE